MFLDFLGIPYRHEHLDRLHYLGRLDIHHCPVIRLLLLTLVHRYLYHLDIPVYLVFLVFLVRQLYLGIPDTQHQRHLDILVYLDYLVLR